jgi:hypothetical protein
MEVRCRKVMPVLLDFSMVSLIETNSGSVFKPLGFGLGVNVVLESDGSGVETAGNADDNADEIDFDSQGELCSVPGVATLDVAASHLRCCLLRANNFASFSNLVSTAAIEREST